MRTISYSESRANDAQTLDAVVDDREEVVITRAGHEPVVMVALEDHESLGETASCCAAPRTRGACWAPSTHSSAAGGVASSSTTLRDLRLLRRRWDDHLWWQAPSRRVLERIDVLLAAVARNGNPGGIGKPEPLERVFSGYWYRRITDEHRLVYRVVDDEVRVAACRYHHGR